MEVLGGKSPFPVGIPLPTESPQRMISERKMHRQVSPGINRTDELPKRVSNVNSSVRLVHPSNSQCTVRIYGDGLHLDAAVTPTLDPEIQGQLAIRSKQGPDMALDAGGEVTVVKAGHHTADDRRNRGFPKGFGRRSNWKAENPGSAMVRTMT